jgi:hypothetical protein
MSETKPPSEHKDRTALYIAIVGATATILAALIGVLPNLLNRGATPVPTPLVIVATAVPTPLAQATAVLPTQTAAAGTGRIDFLVTNNRESAFDFFVDDEYQVTIPPGSYQLLRVVPGERRLTHCPQGTKPSDASNTCETLTREVQSEPYDWQLGGTTPAREKVLLFLLNQIDNDIDVFVDGAEKVPVNAHKIGTIHLEPGTHEVQTCPRGAAPAQGDCGKVSAFEFLRSVEMYVVNVP